MAPESKLLCGKKKKENQTTKQNYLSEIYCRF